MDTHISEFHAVLSGEPSPKKCLMAFDADLDFAQASTPGRRLLVLRKLWVPHFRAASKDSTHCRGG